MFSRLRKVRWLGRAGDVCGLRDLPLRWCASSRLLEVDEEGEVLGEDEVASRSFMFPSRRAAFAFRGCLEARLDLLP